MAAAVVLRTIENLDVPQAGTYEIDPTHSTVEFQVRHLGLAKVRGRFNDFSGTIEIGDDPIDSRVDVGIAATSVDTRDRRRDHHLRSPDFLDAGEYPTIEFHSTTVRLDGEDPRVEGLLTVRGVTRQVTLDVEFEGATRDPWGKERIGVSATTDVDREDFGLTWNQALETGGWLVGKAIRIDLSVEAVRAEG